MRTHSKSLNSIVSGPAVSGYVKGVTEYIEGDTGADSTEFDVDGAIGAAWESIGPTGSGATNIWSTLDVMPTKAKWVEIRINTYALRAAASLVATLYARKTGSSAGIGLATNISDVDILSTGATSVDASNVTTAKIPIDGNGRFDMYTTITADTVAINILLIGWGI